MSEEDEFGIEGLLDDNETSKEMPEFMGEAGLQVTGKSRLEAAYGSGDGDEDGMAVVAKTGQVEVGTYFHQTYRTWRGELNSRWVRNWSILRHHVYGLFTKGHRSWPTYTKLLMIVVLIGSLLPIMTMFLGTLSGSETLMRIFGITRANLWGHVLGTFHNICCWPLITALVVGGMISEDRQHGTSAIYFSRPITRTDYTIMKYISASLILSMIIVFSYCAYYAVAILLNNEGWAYLLDTFPYFLGGLVAAVMLVVTYTSIGLALSSISKGKFFPAVAFIGIVFGSKFVAFFINLLFERDVLYILSPHDNLAHIGQWMMDINTTYNFPVAWSFVSIIIMNCVSLYVLISRVNSLEVTRE
ncbi:MAG: ABC transporter permease [Candidatus Thalassarchaeaceae archaeon]|jgi:ABC-type transport system involved in multi-copper enzyme maturation permease subunit|nr:ABC transporter permease [Candidatus Thalassarchaeaceae archaeon]